MKKGKINKSTREKYEKWIKTNEDWYPSYEPKKYDNPLDHLALHVQCFPLLTSKKYPDKLWRVCVWGADDFGMDFDQPSRMVALEVYNKITDFHTVSDFRALGFINA